MALWHAKQPLLMHTDTERGTACLSLLMISVSVFPVKNILLPLPHKTKLACEMVMSYLNLYYVPASHAGGFE